MNILVVDPQNALNRKERRSVYNRLRFALARFADCVSSASVRFDAGNRGTHRCTINVYIEGKGVVSVGRAAGSCQSALTKSLTKIESVITRITDWRLWLSMDPFSTWLEEMGDQLNRIFPRSRRRMDGAGV